MPNHVIVSSLNWPALTLEDAVGAIGALEFGQVNLALREGWAHLNPSDLAAGGPERIAQEAERLRALIASLEMKRVAAFDASLGDGLSLEEQQRRLAAVCDLGKALGVETLTLPVAPHGTPLEDEAARLRTLVPVAEARGMTLTVATHREQVTATVEESQRLCELVPSLGLTLDVSHMYAGPNQGAGYAALLPLSKLVRLRDATRQHLQVPAGTGEVDFGWLVSELHRIGYDGQFDIHYASKTPTVVLTEGSPDTADNVIRMRNLFVSTERAQGIVRTAPPS
jgi:sugar phosphate isomerase/epimerase